MAKKQRCDHIGDALSAGLQQRRDVPREWGQTRGAYVKRFAVEYAGSAIGDTTKYAIARMRDEDPSFRPCECRGVHRRITHAGQLTHLGVDLAEPSVLREFILHHRKKAAPGPSHDWRITEGPIAWTP